MDRRSLLKAGLAATVASRIAEAAGDAGMAAAELDVQEATLDGLQRAFIDKQLSSRKLCELYLHRIDALNPRLKAILETNPDALQIADGLDRERREKRAVRPLHGIPIVLKDNIDTGDKMKTSAGSLALMGDQPVGDAFLVTKLREAGAVILAKTNLSEWANIRSSSASSGWSGRGAQTRNPFALDRTPSGSSSGTGAAVTANLCAAGIGTETDGSITAPSSVQGLVGIKPTVGLVSRTGIVPISATQDTAGPMTRTVRDAALVLSVIAGVDPADPATAKAKTADYAAGLDAATLKGARLGVVRKLFSSHPDVVALSDAALEALKGQGATLMDVELPHGFDDAELDVLLYELKAGLNAYLASRRPNAKVRTLADVIAFNLANAATEMPLFGQDLFEKAQKKGPLTDPTYLKAVKKCREMGKAIDAAVAKNKLDAFVTPTCDPAFVIDSFFGDRPGTAYATSPAAIAGYPSLTVPMGLARGLPVGLMFFGTAWSEAKLLQLAYAYEQATKHRVAPKL
ncbi:MAG: amidase [Myxococcaceae bacterium]